MKSKRKEVIIIGILLLLMIVIIVGTSWAAFSYSKAGAKLNSITTGSITMTYEETDNVINIDKALPTTDATGKVRLTEGEYFDFTVSSEITGDVNINYEISAKEVGESTIDGSNIKLYLTKLNGESEEELMSPRTYSEEDTSNSYTGRPTGEMSLYTSSMNSSESNRYRLRMYVDEDYNPQGDGGNLSFSVQINVYGKDGLSMEDRMMRTAGSEDFHTEEYKSSITSIVTKGDTIIPESATESWDISEKQNGTVIAYVEDDGTGSGTYKLTIGGEGKIIANYDMSMYFSNFSNVITIDLTYLDTRLTTDMSFMFGILFGSGSPNLQEINFSKEFNTSNVTNMNSMFANCSKLTNIDLDDFDTSNVTEMSYMFLYCDSLTELDLSNFNTSNVTGVLQMFYGTPNLTVILVSRDKWTIPNSTLAGSGITDFTYV